MDCRVICELRDWGVGREGDGEVIDVDDEEKRAEDSSLGNSIGHREGGTQTAFELAGHGPAREVVSKPEA